MALIRHCIIDTTTNKVVNIVEYESIKNGIPEGFENDFPNWLCVPHDFADIGWDYVDGHFVDNRPKPQPNYVVEPTNGVTQ